MINLSLFCQNHDHLLQTKSGSSVGYILGGDWWDYQHFRGERLSTCNWDERYGFEHPEEDSQQSFLEASFIPKSCLSLARRLYDGCPKRDFSVIFADIEWSRFGPESTQIAANVKVFIYDKKKAVFVFNHRNTDGVIKKECILIMQMLTVESDSR